MSALELLREARALYAARPSHAPAEVYPGDGHCPITALCAVDLCADIRRAERALAAAMDTRAPGIPEWNAEHTTAEVLAAFDKAIAAEEAKA